MKGFFSRFSGALKAKKSDRVYLDFASTTPVDPRVEEAMRPFWADSFGNPHARNEEGFIARDHLVRIRRDIARVIEVHPDEITFTSGGTEANNLAILGLVRALEEKGRKITDMHAVVSVIEHASVLECFAELHRRGMKISWLRPDEKGIVAAPVVAKHLKKKTVLVSVMLVNNEIGTIEPVRDIARMLAKLPERPYFHTDASQAPLYLSVLPNSLGVDLMTVDAQKIYGPKGVGFLYHKRGVPLSAILFGGAQESGLRPGTVPLALVAGLGAAFVLAQQEWKASASRVGQLRNDLIVELEKEFPTALVNGDRGARIANNINISFPGVDGEYLAALLNAEGVAVATKSACLPEDSSSYVIEALGLNTVNATSAIRISLGKETSEGDVRKTLQALRNALKKFDKPK